MSYLHGSQIAESWSKMSLQEQLGNIGSEYERALNAKIKNDLGRFNNAVDRMLELFDLSVADKRWLGPRLKEICRAKELACAELYEDKELSGNPEGLKNYFLQFAYWARNK